MKYVQLFYKVDELILLLEIRGCLSSEFFANTKKLLQIDPENIEELNSLIRCFSLTQYANFSKREEILLSEIIDLARDIRTQINPSIK